MHTCNLSYAKDIYGHHLHIGSVARFRRNHEAYRAKWQDRLTHKGQYLVIGYDEFNPDYVIIRDDDFREISVWGKQLIKIDLVDGC